MQATAEVRPDLVRVDVYFDGDLPAERATARVTDAGGAEVAAGVTDDRGVWTFPTPAPGKYTLTAELAGHKTTVRFEVAAPAPAGAGDEGPAVFGGRRDKTLGLVTGVAGLLGVSAVFWARRRRA
ncbi:MAG: carboxypeptidase-like regulatory domain-containing protein [Gemmataceae bacterium]|nr:carboxypeptidase-like regulatory domain-containing protein [Gemmataceae bacterium]